MNGFGVFAQANTSLGQRNLATKAESGRLPGLFLELEPQIRADMAAAQNAGAVPDVPPDPLVPAYTPQPRRMLVATTPKARWPWYVGIGLSALTLVVVADNKGWL